MILILFEFFDLIIVGSRKYFGYDIGPLFNGVVVAPFSQAITLRSLCLFKIPRVRLVR